MPNTENLIREHHPWTSWERSDFDRTKKWKQDKVNKPLNKVGKYGTPYNYGGYDNKHSVSVEVGDKWDFDKLGSTRNFYYSLDNIERTTLVFGVALTEEDTYDEFRTGNEKAWCYKSFTGYSMLTAAVGTWDKRVPVKNSDAGYNVWFNVERIT